MKLTERKLREMVKGILKEEPLSFTDQMWASKGKVPKKIDITDVPLKGKDYYSGELDKEEEDQYYEDDEVQPRKVTEKKLREMIKRLMKEELKKTKKHDDDSALVGNQDELPDKLQKGIIDKKSEGKTKISEKKLKEMIKGVLKEKIKLDRPVDQFPIGTPRIQLSLPVSVWKIIKMELDEYVQDDSDPDGNIGKSLKIIDRLLKSMDYGSE